MNTKIKIIVGIGLILVAILICYFYTSRSQPVTSAAPIITTGPEAKEIESLGLAEFDPSNDVKSPVLSAEDKTRYKEVADALQLGGDGTDKTKVQASLTAINTLITKYPEYADLYVLRVTDSLLLGSTDYGSMTADLNNALEYRQSTTYTSAYTTDTPILLLKARVDALSGDTKDELDDFQKALDVDPTADLGSDFFGTGGTSPDSNSNPSAPQLTDFDTLVQTYPNDYRSYLDRGLYYASFTIFDEQYYTPAIADLTQAASINSQSPVADYMLGELALKDGLLSMAAASDISDITGASGGYKDQQRNKALNYFNQAIAIDPTYKYAYGGAAEANLELKNYADAIQDYTQEIQLDPNNAGAYNDKGLAELDIDQFDQSIIDLSKAIQLKESNPTNSSNLDLSNSYENLGDAEVKDGKYDAAIAAYSKAIGKEFASEFFIMSIDQIRSIYPEFSSISDQDLLEGLRQKYLPNMTSTDFNSSMVKNKTNEDSSLSDLYAARGDAYLKSGNSAKAAIEYGRALHSDPLYTLTAAQQAVYNQ